MSTIFMSSKGGNCTTVTAAAFSVLSAQRNGKTLLIDLCGDVPAVLGLPESTGPGINDWLAERNTADAQALLLLGTTVTENLMVVQRGSRFVDGEPRWKELAAIISDSSFNVIIDAGTGYLPDELVAVIGEVTMVVKPCYLTLRRATQHFHPHNVIVIKEEGRALTVNDVSHVLHAPIAAQIPYDSAISRAVDAGLLVSRAEVLFSPYFTN